MVVRSCHAANVLSAAGCGQANADGRTSAPAEACAWLFQQVPGRPVDAVARASHAHMHRKSALKNTVQRLGEPGDRAFDVMQFVQAK